MIKLLIIIIAAIIIAAILFTFLKKAVKLALFVGLVIIIFLIITGIIYPETNIIQKGKNYILEKSGTALDKGKDKLTTYVVVETNETITKAKGKILNSLD